MSRKKTRIVAWLDPADAMQRRLIRQIASTPQEERHAYILSLLLRGYETTGASVYDEVMRALCDYQPKLNTEQKEAEAIPENMLDFLFSLQKEGE